MILIKESQRHQNVALALLALNLRDAYYNTNRYIIIMYRELIYLFVVLCIKVDNYVIWFRFVP